MPEKYRLYLDQMFRVEVADALLRLHAQDHFKDHLVILSEKRAKWILTKE
jgi:hypothetical protein